MIKEITNSIKAALYQRISSPLYGTYICTWLIYNWVIVLPLIFGTKKFDDRIDDFKKVIAPDATGFEYHTILIPLCITAALLIVHPLLQRFLFIYTEWNKSEGLKKRDKYSSATMLSLEQSNELRASVQKVQQFHQEVLKNKDEEINEYKRQAETKSHSVDLVNESNLRLIEEKTQLESEKSKLSAELAKQKGNFDILNKKYERLGGLFSKVKKLKYDFRIKINSDSWYVNRTVLSELPRLISPNDETININYSKYIARMQNASDDPEWLYACNDLIIRGFSQVWNYDMADDFFTNLVKPNISTFDKRQISQLISVMGSNSQISERRRADKDMQIVKANLESRAA